MASAAALARGGILYAEDFESAAPRTAAICLAPPPITEETLRRACAEAHAEGMQAARAEQAQLDAQLRTAALQAIADRMGQAREEWAQFAEANAAALAGTMLGMLAAALPALCARHARTEIEAVIALILPGLAEAPSASLRVHAELAGFVADMLKDTGSTLSIEIIADSGLPPGDLRIDWGTGGARRDTRQLRQAIGEALAPLDLSSPEED